MIFLSRERAAEVNKKLREERRKRRLKASEELVTNYVYKGDK